MVYKKRKVITKARVAKSKKATKLAAPVEDACKLFDIHRAMFLDGFRQYMEAGAQQGAEVSAATYMRLYNRTALALGVDIAALELEVPRVVTNDAPAPVVEAPKAVTAATEPEPVVEDDGQGDLNLL